MSRATREDRNQLADHFLACAEPTWVDLGEPLSPHFGRYFVRWAGDWWRMTEAEFDGMTHSHTTHPAKWSWESMRLWLEEWRCHRCGDKGHQRAGCPEGP